MNTLITMINKLSIVVPVFNESHTIRNILEKLNALNLISNIRKEIIVVNDASNDATEENIFAFIKDNKELNIKYYKHKTNMGKGAAFSTGLLHSEGEIVLVQDADLEYDPNEINLLLKPIVDGYADVVYGSRFMGGNPHRVLFFWHSIGNKFLTFISNMFTNLNLTDIETCYKLFKTDLVKTLKLEEKRFGFEPEVTAKISKIKGIRIYEVGISYYGRTYDEGKKIKWRDGVRAIYCIVKYNLFP